MMSKPGTTLSHEWMKGDTNMPLWPYSVSGYSSWKSRSMSEIREALADKVSHQAAVLQENFQTGSEREDVKKLATV